MSNETMDNELDIKPEDDATGHVQEEASPEKAELERSVEEDSRTARRGGVGPVFFVAGLLVASLAGGAIGIVGSKYLAGPDKLPGLRQELKTDLTKIEARLSTSEDKAKDLQKMEGDLTSQLEALQKTISGQGETISELSDQLDAVAQLKDTVGQINERLIVLEGLAGQKSGLVSGAKSIETRLKALEEQAATPAQPSVKPEDLAGLKDEVEALKTQMDNLKAAALKTVPSPQKNQRETINLPKQADGASREETLRILMDTFPRAKMLAAVRAQEHLAAQKPSWLQRALRKHIRIRKEKPVDPYVLINSAQNKLKDGDISAALKRISELNPPVRAAASEWVSAAKTALKQQARTQE